MRVLVCDDHAVFAESFAAVLAHAGYEVPAVTYSPDEALTALARHDVDVCILDMRFPSGDIVSWLPRLEAVAPRARPVLLTGEIDREVVRRALAAGARGVVDKTARIADICATLNRVHAGEIVAEADLLAPTNSPSPGVSPEAYRLAQSLTSRERETLCHLVCGRDTKVLSRLMGVTWSTARSYVQSLLTKLGVHSRIEAAAVAVRYGMVSGETGEWLL